MNPRKLEYYTVQNIVGPDSGLRKISDKLLKRLNVNSNTNTEFQFKFEDSLNKPRIVYGGTNQYITLPSLGQIVPCYFTAKTNSDPISYKSDFEIENLIRSGYRVKPCGVWYSVFNDGLLVRFRHFLNSYTTIADTIQVEYECFIHNNGTIELNFCSKNSIYTKSIEDISFSETKFTSYILRTPGTYHYIWLLSSLPQDIKFGGARSAANISSADKANLIKDWPGLGDFGATIRIVPPSQTIKKILPRVELRRKDVTESIINSSGLFDDARTIMINDDIINMPTRLPRLLARGSTVGNPDPTLYSDFDITGTVNFSAIDPWLPKVTNQQIYSPYSETQQPEQNLKDTEFYLTGTAITDIGFGFDGNLGQKTKITYELPILASTTLEPLSACLYYYDTRTNSIKYAGERPHNRGIGPFRDARLYTPLGTPTMTIMSGSPELGGGGILPNTNARWITKSTIDTTFQTNFATSDLLTSSFNFSKNDVEPIIFNNQLKSPFLLEKAIFEFPLEAGNSWLNDFTQISLRSDFYPDIGGPCVTIGLIRESKEGSTSKNYEIQNKFIENQVDIYDTTRREVICSGTMIPYRDSVRPIFPLENPLLYRGFNQNPNATEELKNLRLFQLKKEGFVNYGSTPGAIIGDATTTQFTGSVTINSVPQVVNCFYYSKISNSKSTQTIQTIGKNPSTYLYNETFDLTNNGGLYQSYKGLGITGNPNISDNRNIFGDDKLFFPLTKIKNSFYEHRDFISASFDANLALFPDDAHCAMEFGVTKTSVTSPYLLFPGDRLTFFVSKHRSVNTSSWILRDPPDPIPYTSVYTDVPAEISASHDIKIPSGTLKITLYGSYVKEKREYNNFSESPFSSQAYGVIGDQPVLDQFENYNDRDLIGTTFDRIIKDVSGSVLASEKYGDGNRLLYRKYVASLSYGLNPLNGEDSRKLRRAGSTPYMYKDILIPRRFVTGSSYSTGSYYSPWSKYASEYTRSPYEIMGSNRVIKHTSQEIIYDSLAPRKDEILNVEGVKPIYIESNDYSKKFNAGFVCLGKTNVNNNLQPYDFSDLGNIKVKSKYYEWVNSFPFESKYSAAKRQKDVVVKYVATGSGGTYEVENLMFEIGKTRINDIECRDILLDLVANVEEDTVTEIPNKSEANKFFFGFGNGKLEFVSGSLTSQKREIISQQFPVTQLASSYKTTLPSSKYSLTGALGVSIKGWKYGLYNGFPSSTSCVFRRNNFGQFRDMLEQRQFTVFLSDSGLTTEGPVSSRFVQQVLTGSETQQAGMFIDVNPIATSLQNLSTFATSSLPYFDGFARNR